MPTDLLSLYALIFQIKAKKKWKNEKLVARDNLSLCCPINACEPFNNAPFIPSRDIIARTNLPVECSKQVFSNSFCPRMLEMCCLHQIKIITMFRKQVSVWTLHILSLCPIQLNIGWKWICKLLHTLFAKQVVWEDTYRAFLQFPTAGISLSRPSCDVLYIFRSNSSRTSSDICSM